MEDGHLLFDVEHHFYNKDEIQILIKSIIIKIFLNKNQGDWAHRIVTLVKRALKKQQNENKMKPGKWHI